MGASASTSYSLEDVKVKYEQLESTLGPVELPAPFAAAPDAIPLVKACEAVGTAGPLPRPVGAVGTFLRIVTVNDVYKLDNYPNVATAIAVEKFAAEQLGGVVKATINGDFVSPCIITALDGGRAMIEALNVVGFDYACLGNHEFDLGFEGLAKRLADFNGTVVNSNATHASIAHLPKTVEFAVGEKSCVLGGFVTNDANIYPPSARPELAGVADACAAVWAEATAARGGAPADLFVPMTHQLTPEDKATGKALAKHKELAKKTPVLLGGHDHDVFIDQVGEATLVKVGADCDNIGVVDIYWDAKGALHSSVTLRAASEYAKAPKAAAFVKKQADFLESMMKVEIATIPEGPAMSTKLVRFESSAMAAYLLTMVKNGLKQDGVEICMLQGGAIRAKKDYSAGPFTMGDLFKEFAYDCNQAVVPIRGDIIAASVLSSRTSDKHPEKGAPNFLHCDEGVTITDAHEVTHINGKPLEPEKLYMVAVYQFLLSGLNVIQPLLGYVQENVPVPDVEACLPIKEIVISACMKDAWRSLLGFDEWDTDKDGVVSPEELDVGIGKVFKEADKDNSGSIALDELATFISNSKGRTPASTALLSNMIKALDTNGDGEIDANELRAIAF